MSEWISVEDRMPPDYEMVIVEGGVAYRIHNGDWITQTGFASGRRIQWDVTHWMPFPKAPSEGAPWPK